jgi:ACS family tartrate transporter-like MFS transporter
MKLRMSGSGAFSAAFSGALATAGVVFGSAACTRAGAPAALPRGHVTWVAWAGRLSLAVSARGPAGHRAGVCGVALVPNRPHQARWLQPQEAGAQEQVLQQERLQRQVAPGHIQGLKALWGDRRLWLLAVLYLGIATSFYGFSFWIPRFVGDALAQQSPSPALVNLLCAIPYGLAVVVMLLVDRAADRHADVRMYVAIPLAVSALALGLSIVATGPLRLVLISIATAAAFSSLGPVWATPLQFLGGQAAAGGIAPINSFGNTGGFLAPIVMGRLMLRPQGDSLALAYLAGVLLVSALVALLATRRRGAAIRPSASLG